VVMVLAGKFEVPWSQMKESVPHLSPFRIVSHIWLIPVKVFWVVTLYSFAVGYKHFKGLWRQKGHPKHWYPTATLHGITTQMTWTWIFTAVNFVTSRLCSWDFNVSIN
jgi:hypothetical protein